MRDHNDPESIFESPLRKIERPAVRLEGGVQFHITGRNGSLAEEDRLRQGTSRAVGRWRTLLYGERGGQKQQAQAHNRLAHISHALVLRYCIGITALALLHWSLAIDDCHFATVNLEHPSFLASRPVMCLKLLRLDRARGALGRER